MTFLRRLVELIRGRGRDAALMEEMEAHRAFTQDELERSGLSAAEAAAESRRRMGNVTLAREDVREFWIARWIDHLRQNARFGTRGLLREPVYALTAIVTLGLGTAAMTTVFGIVDAELWRLLPFREADRLVVIRSTDTTVRRRADAIGIDELKEWRATMPAFSEIAASGDAGRRAIRLEFTESLHTAAVTANFFTTLGRGALAGRVFSDADARGSDAVVIGSRAWKRTFDSRPDLVGKRVFVDNEARTIVGIVETNDSRGPEDDMFVPIDESPGARHGDEAAFYSIIARLAPDGSEEVGLAQIQSALDRRAAVDQKRAGHVASVRTISEHYRMSDARSLYFFLAAAALVLVLTTVNVAGLTLSRSVRRAPEFALRGALGGGVRAIAAQLAIEGALIAVPGCLLGLWLAANLVGVVAQMAPSDFLHRGREIVVDYRAVAMCAAVVVITMAGLALAPLGVAKRANGALAMTTGQRSGGMRSAGKARERLLIAQMALTVVLLAVGTLFLKSFVAEANIPLGFVAKDGWSMFISLSTANYRDPELARQYVDAVVERARAIPGVQDAAAATSSPLTGGFGAELRAPGSPADTDGARTIYRAVTPSYFRTIGTPIMRGRPFAVTDVASAPSVAIVNERFAREMFPGGDAIGKQVEIGKARTTEVGAGVVTIVGIAGDVKDLFLSEGGVANVYVPLAQRPATMLEFIVRGNGGNANMPAALRAVVVKADPALPVNAISPIDKRVEIALQRGRFNLSLVTGFALIAVLIGAIGIYGAMAYAAVARAREFGVRLALGASPATLLRGALWHAARFGVAGAAIGIVGALAAAAWIGDALYTIPGEQNGMLLGVRTTDPAALGAAAAGVILVALLSGAIPARRLARIDPVKALRAD